MWEMRGSLYFQPADQQCAAIGGGAEHFHKAWKKSIWSLSSS